jgi:hypothetical protein
MAVTPAKWRLHGILLVIVGVAVVPYGGWLLSDSSGRGLSGLGEFLVGGALVFGYGVHALFTTALVHLVGDRIAVAFIHLATPAIVILVGLFWVR